MIEYNCRLGDPETEVVIPRLKNDLVDIFKKLGEGKLNEVVIEEDPRTATTIMLTAGGYPGDYKKGDVIHLPEMTSEESMVFHAGTQLVDNQLVTNGGRVLALTSFGSDIPSAIKVSNETAAAIQFDGKYYREDIGLDLIK